VISAQLLPPLFGAKTHVAAHDWFAEFVPALPRPPKYRSIAQHYATASDASFAFKVDGQVVASYTADQIRAASQAATGSADNHMVHFDVDIAGYANAGTQHTIELVDTLASPSIGKRS
jgi:hypothetical protein